MTEMSSRLALVSNKAVLPSWKGGLMLLVDSNSSSFLESTINNAFAPFYI